MSTTTVTTKKEKTLLGQAFAYLLLDMTQKNDEQILEMLLDNEIIRDCILECKTAEKLQDFIFEAVPFKISAEYLVEKLIKANYLLAATLENSDFVISHLVRDNSVYDTDLHRYISEVEMTQEFYQLQDLNKFLRELEYV